MKSLSVGREDMLFDSLRVCILLHVSINLFSVFSVEIYGGMSTILIELSDNQTHSLDETDNISMKGYFLRIHHVLYRLR